MFYGDEDVYIVGGANSVGQMLCIFPLASMCFSLLAVEAGIFKVSPYILRFQY